MKKRLTTITIALIISITLGYATTNIEKRTTFDNIQVPEKSVFYMNDLYYIYLVNTPNKLVFIDKESKEVKEFSLNDSDIKEIYDSTFGTKDSSYNAEKKLLDLLSYFKPSEIVSIKKIIPNGEKVFLYLTCKNIDIELEDTILYGFSVLLELNKEFKLKQFHIKENTLPYGFGIFDLLNFNYESGEADFFVLGVTDYLLPNNLELYYRAIFTLDYESNELRFNSFRQQTLPDYFISKKYFYNMTNQIYKDSIFAFMLSKNIFKGNEELFLENLDDVVVIMDLSLSGEYIHLLCLKDENTLVLKTNKETSSKTYIPIKENKYLNLQDYKIQPTLYGSQLFLHPKTCNCIEISKLND